MKAVLVEKDSQHLVVGDWEDPVIGENDILIRTKATALNRADLLQKVGKYPPPPGESTILGLEAAGIVEEVGSAVSQWKAGDRVCALLPGGGYAEKVKVPSGHAIRVPDALSFEEAAAIPEVFLTAYLNLFLLGGLHPGQSVLVHAAAGGVGPAVIQLTKQSGARAFATVRSNDKASACLNFGADAAINSTDEDFSLRANALTDGLGVNVIMDPVGAPYFEKNLQCLATDGKLIVIAFMGGNVVPQLDLQHLLLRRWQLIGSTLRALSVTRKSEIIKGFVQRFMPMFADGRLRPTIDSIVDVQDVNEAHARMEGNLNIGKIVIRWGQAG